MVKPYRLIESRDLQFEHTISSTHSYG